ncbi:hypothetical protein J2S43_002799 [Catenuloplanes nepalensis]|uniref:DUF3592 domain-containing protein n=1 Tax=Catenuloplanes nepalensis TaxID=587533 RepID=A0ABT9MS64_9ACTN|nr:hypothetical protein [Catenuloplanes nepalensis]MDP9794287.1 hypothetical protein [Catenuloplanes nepalensis]
MGRFPRRAMVISLLLPVIGTLVLGGIGVAILAGWFGHEGRATTVVTGRGDAMRNGGEITERMDVWWEDADGEGHEARFRVPGGSTLESGPFDVRYDPADPEGIAFPAGAEAELVHAPSPPWWVLLFAAPFALLAGGVAWAWRRRVEAARLAAGRPGVPYRVVPIVFETAAGIGRSRTVDSGLGTLLVPPDVPFDPDACRVAGPVPELPGARWQHTMWSPGFGCLRPGQEVTAHVGEGKGGRAVLVTGDGTVWPVSRLREGPVPGLARVSGTSAINSRVSPGKDYLLAPLAGIFVAPVALATPGFVLLLPLVILFGFSMTIAVWAFRGGIPADH